MTPEPDYRRLRAWPPRIGAPPGRRARRAGGRGRPPRHLVGGAVRDLLRGDERVDVDIVVEGDAVALARRLAPDARVHERFGTATVRLDGPPDRPRRAPGARPTRIPGRSPRCARAARRRPRPPRLHRSTRWRCRSHGARLLATPTAGRADLARRLLRVLHGASFADDPTRALRAARYAARLGFTLEPRTERCCARADLAIGLLGAGRGRAAPAGGRGRPGRRPSSWPPGGG